MTRIYNSIVSSQRAIKITYSTNLLVGDNSVPLTSFVIAVIISDNTAGTEFLVSLAMQQRILNVKY